MTTPIKKWEDIEKEFDEEFLHEANEFFCCPAGSEKDANKCSCQLREIKSFFRQRFLSTLEATVVEEREGTGVGKDIISDTRNSLEGFFSDGWNAARKQQLDNIKELGL